MTNKNNSRFFKILLITLFLFLTLFSSGKRAYAYAGVADISFDPSNFFQNSLTAANTTISAGSNTVTAAMTTAEKIKVFVLDPAARAAVRTIIQRLTNSTVNWINSGFRGNPSYVTDPGRFFLNVADEQASRFLSGPNLNALCTPFRAQVRLALVQNYLQDERENYTCSLSILRDNYDQFTQDFRYGGWDAWFELTQNPQNNPYGSYIAARNELNTNVSTPIAKFSKQLEFGRGFLSYEKCPAGAELDPSLGTGDCRVEKQTVTPGVVIESQLQNALGSGVRQLELAKSFDEILGALVTQLFVRVVGPGNGLFGDGTSNSLPPTPTTGGPIITLQGQDPMYVLTGMKYIEPGWVALDANGRDVSSEVVASSTVTSNVPGTYNVVYTITRGGVLVASESREVIVGTSVNANDQCLDPGFRTYASNWSRVLDSMRIRLGDINEGDIQRKVRLMIQAGNAERDYLVQQNQMKVVADLEDLLIRLNRFSDHAQRAEEDSIQDVIELQREREDLKGYIVRLLATYACDIPPIDLGTPIDETVPPPGGGGGASVCGITNMGTGSGAWNIVGTIDPGSVTVVNGDSSVLSWPETTQITGGSWNGLWDINFGARATWPECSAFPGPPNDGPIQYTIWLFTNVGGEWVGSGFIRNWVGGTNNGGPGDPKLQLPANWIYSNRWAPMPYCRAFSTGDEVGFMVTSGNQRLGDGVQCTAVRERSNIVRVRLP